MAKRLRNQPFIVLTGPPGTGKSSNGLELARMTGYAFADGDELFADKFDVSVTNFVNDFGWHTFRMSEFDVNSEYCAKRPSRGAVYTPGGGALGQIEFPEWREKNVALFQNARATILYVLPFEDLDRSVEVLWQRILEDKQTKHTRPGLDRKKLEARVYERDPFYKEVATAIIYSGQRDVAQTTALIMKYIPNIT